MDEKVRHKLRVKKLREMKNPVILMNETDFKDFVAELEAKMINFEEGTVPTYEGVPIKTRDFIKRGQMIIYDDIMFGKQETYYL